MILAAARRDDTGTARAAPSAPPLLEESVMDLVLLVCLASSPESCHEERLTVSFEQVSDRLCMAGAIPTIAEWVGDHPEWTVERWRCGSAREARLASGTQ